MHLITPDFKRNWCELLSWSVIDYFERSTFGSWNVLGSKEVLASKMLVKGDEILFITVSDSIGWWGKKWLLSIIDSKKLLLSLFSLLLAVIQSFCN